MRSPWSARTPPRVSAGTTDRPWFRDAVAEETAQGRLRAHVAGARAVLDRVAEVTAMLDVAAATGPEVAGMREHDEDPRYTVHAAAAAELVCKPGARPGRTAEEAADVLFGLLSPELYLLLVRDRGWSSERWGRWACETLCAQLCAPLSPPR